jgi:hypothetical protein
LTDNNDVLPIYSAKWVEIDIQDIAPVMKSWDVAIVLWINQGSVVWFKFFPIETNLSIEWATSYKVMKINWFKKWCEDNNYTKSIWYSKDSKKIWIWDANNLFPKLEDVVWLKFWEWCYDIWYWETYTEVTKYFDGCYGWRYTPSYAETPKKVYKLPTSIGEFSWRNWWYICIYNNWSYYCSYHTSIEWDYYVWDFTDTTKVSRCRSPAVNFCSYNSYRCWIYTWKAFTFRVYEK